MLCLCAWLVMQWYVCLTRWCSAMCVWHHDTVQSVCDKMMQCYACLTCDAVLCAYDMVIDMVMQCYVCLARWCSTTWVWPGGTMLCESGQVMQCCMSGQVMQFCVSLARWWVLCESGQVMQCYMHVARWCNAKWIWPGDAVCGMFLFLGRFPRWSWMTAMPATSNVASCAPSHAELLLSA